MLQRQIKVLRKNGLGKGINNFKQVQLMRLKAFFYLGFLLFSFNVQSQEVNSVENIRNADTLWLVNKEDGKIKYVTTTQIVGLKTNTSLNYYKGRFVKFENDTVYMESFLPVSGEKNKVQFATNQIEMVHPLFYLRVGNGLKPVIVIASTVGILYSTVAAAVNSTYEQVGKEGAKWIGIGTGFIALQQFGIWAKNKKYYMKKGWVLKQNPQLEK